MTDLLLKRATASPGEVYNVMCEERIVGRIMLSADAQFPWVWTLTYATTKTAHPPTATSQPARQPCWRSPRAGTGIRDAAGPPPAFSSSGPRPEITHAQGADCLGVDRRGNLCWDGKPVEVR